MWYTWGQLVSLALGMPSYRGVLEGDNNNFIHCHKEELPLCPNCIFGCFPVNCKLNNTNKKMLIFCLLEAKHKIDLSWKSINRPSRQSWIDGLLQCLAMEKFKQGKYNTLKPVKFLEGEDFAVNCCLFLFSFWLLSSYFWPCGVKSDNQPLLTTNYS